MAEFVSFKEGSILRNKITPLRMIRKFCIVCMGGNQKAPKGCESKECPLYPFRLGKQPTRQGIGKKGQGRGISLAQAKGIKEIKLEGRWKLVKEE